MTKKNRGQAKDLLVAKVEVPEPYEEVEESSDYWVLPVALWDRGRRNRCLLRLL